MTKKVVGRPFVPGDPRINRKGRPKSFNTLRALTKQIAIEAISDNELDMSRVEAIIRDWMGSPDFNKQKAALELAYGKVPDKTEITGKDGSAIKVKIVKRDE